MNAPDQVHQDYRLAGLPLRLTAAGPAALTRVATWFAAAFVVVSPAADADTQAPLILRVHQADRPPPAAQDLATTLDTAACRVQRAGTQVRLTLPQATCGLDLAAGRADLWLAPGFWDQPEKRRQGPWLLSLAWLLRGRGRYTLHAAAVARHGQGLLIAGDSGSGKSTTALHLIRRGWDYLADDAILLEPGPPPRLWALATGFACPAVLAGQWPGATGPSLDGKRHLDPRDLYPDRHRLVSRAVALLFPHITPWVTRSRLEPLTPAERLVALLPAAGGLSTDRDQAAAQLPPLAALAQALPGWRWHAGPDARDDAHALEAQLAAHGLAPAPLTAPHRG